MNVLDFLQEDEDYNDTISGILYYCMECGYKVVFVEENEKWYFSN